MSHSLNASIFKAYDIRGIVDQTLTESAVHDIGRAFGQQVRQAGGHIVAIGRDGRLSGPRLIAALSTGIRAAGVNVLDIGMVATPMLYYAALKQAEGNGIMVTGSHNPPEYNGLKMMLAGAALYGPEIQALYQQIMRADWLPVTTTGETTKGDIADDYEARIVADIQLARPLKIVVDAGNGIPGAYGPKLYRALGCEVVELFCEVDGHFPNHHPDPAHPENLQDVIHALQTTDAEIGFAFDGDGDRLGVVTKDGQIIYPDRQLMLFASDVLSRNPGAQIIYDVKCSRKLAQHIEAQGGQPLMWKTGHSLVKAKLKETGAPLAGEMSGHIFFKERWYGFDDGLYAGARLLEILSRSADPSALLNALPNSTSTPELQICLAEGENVALIDALRAQAAFPSAQTIVTIDGLRVEYADGFGLIRASNTTPVAVLRFEADHDVALQRIQQEFRQALQTVQPDLPLPF
ncbi:phosphomannomutase/phosphoglucomutase [Parvibium lacunae]|uniref:Phosphomannomutase/phosphoglucomutase n=1 Tax=Parvibium lacunae TaxID=1888893 RepID=A0A368L1G4_9BURK|nr:phosphomannomutase/phosphoglucomutase [Parvibium lacunae]RCS57399.1 phosphomannomutase/phosphoglucomutase [Parvibium lacunae]